MLIGRWLEGPDGMCDQLTKGLTAWLQVAVPALGSGAYCIFESHHKKMPHTPVLAYIRVDGPCPCSDLIADPSCGCVGAGQGSRRAGSADTLRAGR